VLDGGVGKLAVVSGVAARGAACRWETGRGTATECSRGWVERRDGKGFFSGCMVCGTTNGRRYNDEIVDGSIRNNFNLFK
jgi:hypothetical protein